jgi:hypothetical protein
LAEKAKKDAAVKAAIEAAFQAGGDRIAVIPPPGRAEELDQRYQNALKWAGGLLERMDVERSVTIAPPHWKVMQVHHHLEGREIYFFINAHRDKEYRFTAAFPTGDRTPWRWDPETGQREVFSAAKGGKIPISLGTLESLLLVFEPDLPGEPTRKPEVREGDAFKIETAWDLTLRRVDGKVEKRKLKQLADLGLSQDPFLKTFGGTVEYRTAFELAKGDRRVLDLGRVHGCSEAKLNGKPLGVRWYGRHRYDLQGAARQGRNELVVKVSTVLSNYCRSLDDATAKRWAGRNKQVPTGLAGPVTLK